jgi:serine/threonine protein kinase
MTETRDEQEKTFAPGSIVFENFKVISSIGSGGMGAVYKVRHMLLDTDMALKVLFKGQSSDTDVMRFQNEARTLSKLAHPNVARVNDFGMEDGTPYLAMDFVEGRTLEVCLREHRLLSILEFVEIFSQVCDGLAHAHSRNIIHRDLKAGNILLSEGQNGNFRPVIVDFGVAKLQEEMKVGELTQAGGYIGSPLYSSPEQINGDAISASSDMYSLGCIMFQSLTGQVPFLGDSVLETLTMHCEKKPPLQKIDASVPLLIREMVANLLEKKAVDRKWSASELAQALDSGRLLGGSRGADENAVTIPPRMKRIPKNESTAARISLNFDPLYTSPATTNASNQFPKRLFWILPVLALLGLVTLGVSRLKVGSEAPPAVSQPVTEKKITQPSSESMTNMESAVLPKVYPRNPALTRIYQCAVSDAKTFNYANAKVALLESLKLIENRPVVGDVALMDIYGWLFICAERLGQTKDAESYLQNYLDAPFQRTRGERVIHVAREGNVVFVAERRFDIAIKLTTQLLRVDLSRFPPAQAALYNHLGLMYGLQQNKSECLRWYRKALEVLQLSDHKDSSEYQTILNRLGAAENLSELYKESRAHFEESAAMAPADGEWDLLQQEELRNLMEANQYLARMCIAGGECDKARAHAKQVLKLISKLKEGPRSPNVIMVTDTLKIIEQVEAAQKLKGAK